MVAILTFLSILAYLWMFFVFLQRTFLAIAPGRHQISGAIFMMNDLVYVLPALLIVPMVGAENIRVLFYVRNDSAFFINVIIIFSLWGFVLSLGLISRFFGRMLFYDLRRVYRELENPRIARRLIGFNRIMILSIPLMVLINVGVFGGQHALFSAAFYNLNPGAIRYANEASAFSAYTKHYFHIVSLLVAPCIALPLYRNRKTEKWLSILMVFVAMTAHGSKSPFIVFLIVLLFAQVEKIALNKGHENGSTLFSPKNVMLISGGLISVLIVFYLIVTNFFFGEDVVFWDYFWNRTFVGQMAGVYEQFNLYLFDTAFTWHGVPFASFFLDYPNFHKELMLVSENRFDPNSIGIKVTFFAAEAYAMAGWTGVVLAPPLMALQFVITFLILNRVMDKLILRARELSKYVTAFFFASYFSLTDGISEMMLYKGAVLIMILLTPLVLGMLLRGTILVRRRGGNPLVALPRS